MPTNPRGKKSSPKQQAVLNYGVSIRALSNSYCLARFLHQNGRSNLAWRVEQAIMIAKALAVEEYKQERLRLDPEWKPAWPELGAPTPAHFREQDSGS